MSDIQLTWDAISLAMDVGSFVEYLLKARRALKSWALNENSATESLRAAYARREQVSRLELTEALRDLSSRIDAGGARSSIGRSPDAPLESMTLLEAWQRDITDEPSAERLAMLEHASVSALDERLEIGTRTRIRRVIRELDPPGLLALRGISMLPLSANVSAREGEPAVRNTPGQSLRAFFDRIGAPDALVASGCLHASVGGGGFGVGPHNELALTKTAYLVLEGTRSYFATRVPPFPIPGREPHGGGRTEDECWNVLNAEPLLLSEARRHAARPRHSFPHIINYTRASGPDLGATISIGGFEREAAERLEQLFPVGNGPEPARGHRASRLTISIDRNDGSSSEVGLSIDGPDDVIRVLANDLDATWW